MFTPVILLLILIVPYWITSAIYRDRKKSRFAGVIGLSLLFIFAGMSHFVKTEPMSNMLPPLIPFKILIVYISGIIELIVAAGLLYPKYRINFGWFAIFLFIVFLPVNIYAAYNRVDIGGHELGMRYLFFRIPVQIIFIFWAYWFGVRK